MPYTPTKAHPEHSGAMTNEADIGSGEKTPGELETEQIIQEIPPLPAQGSSERRKADAGQPEGADAGAA